MAENTAVKKPVQLATPRLLKAQLDSAKVLSKSKIINANSVREAEMQRKLNDLGNIALMQAEVIQNMMRMFFVINNNLNKDLVKADAQKFVDIGIAVRNVLDNVQLVDLASVPPAPQGGNG